MAPRSQERAHRPQPEKITDLASRVRAGEVRLPKFQRTFVWTRQQVIDLLDSISRNYPIGSLLLWDSPMSLASERSIADLEIEQFDERERWTYLLDGCQRLSTICGALYWEPKDDPRSFWNLVYDLDEERFLHRSDLEEPPIHQVPLRLLTQPSLFFKRLSGLDSEEQENAAHHLFDSFTKYETAVVTLKSASFSEIGRIFERVNTRGTPLTTVEFIRAATWRRDFDLLDAIDRVRNTLAAKHYGKIERKLLLRAISAAVGLGFATGDIERLPSVSHGHLVKTIEETERAARLAVDFLTVEIGTPTAEALPYPNQLAVVIELFRQLPRPDGQQFAEIRSWFWRTALSRYYEGWNSRKMAADMEAVTTFAQGESKRIDVEIAPLSTRWWLSNQYRRESSWTKALALMLAAAGPVDLITGAAIDTGKALADTNSMQFHHLFPKAKLGRDGLTFEQANVLANVVMLTAISNQKISDQAPPTYLQAEIDFSGEAEVRRRLDTCLISPPAFEAAMRGDYKAFLSARAETLLNWAEDLIRRGGRTEASISSPDADTRRRANEVEVEDTDTDD
ncbi:GmrSD restriction endonuclease domain-containing protein [Actinomadura litoris]|uniref:DUF262 domain-containing protein n=1 Tax=Actinomadura litoris TaxID=2678616 RepID=A0A7K1KTZ4_9ACTN|nr:DUF262 domain-containing protein [Actinomadura litoris]MUN35406.1 DUF262 domain-containing protein [Actinomadura litoris]